MTNLLNMNSISQLKLWLCHVKLCKDVHRIKIDFIWSHFCLLSRVNDNHTDNAIEASWQRLLMLMRLDFNAFCLKEKRNISALNCFSYQIQGSFVNNHENMKPYSYIKLNELSIFLNWHILFDCSEWDKMDVVKHFYPDAFFVNLGKVIECN